MIIQEFTSLPRDKAVMRISTPIEVRAALKPLFDLVNEKFESGEPGALFCQLDQHKMTITFLPQRCVAGVREAAAS